MQLDDFKKTNKGVFVFLISVYNSVFSFYFNFMSQ